MLLMLHKSTDFSLRVTNAHSNVYMIITNASWKLSGVGL